MNFFKRKKGMLGIRKVIIYIFIILVLITILFWIFKLPLLGWIKNLPGFGASDSNEDELIDLGGQQDEVINTGSVDYEQRCFEYCRFLGECKETGETDEVSLGKMDCGTNKACFAKKSVEQLRSGELLLDQFYYTENGKEISFFGKNSIELHIGEIKKISYRAEFNDKFCYYLKSNGARIIKQYSIGHYGGITLSWTVNEGVLEFVAWNPEGDEFVIKRIEIKKSEEVSEYDDGEIIKNENFNEKILSSKEGDVFYLFSIPSNLGIRGEDADFRVVVEKEKIGIYISGEALDNKKDRWVLLDCNLLSIKNWLGIGELIKKDNIKTNLEETLMSCDI